MKRLSLTGVRLASLVFLGTIVTQSALAASVILAPGETQYISSGNYVTCGTSGNGGGGSTPLPQPTPPPVVYVEEVRIHPDEGCLNSITPRDGKAIMKAAAACDDGNRERRIMSLYDRCSLKATREIPGLGDSVIAKANTVIYDGQKERVRLAASLQVYSCERSR